MIVRHAVFVWTPKSRPPAVQVGRVYFTDEGKLIGLSENFEVAHVCDEKAEALAVAQLVSLERCIPLEARMEAQW